MVEYYVVLISIVVAVVAVQVGYELRLKIKFKNNDKCSYCGQHVNDNFKMSLPVPGVPITFKCKRWWCSFLKYLGYITVK